ncbi:MAG: hypothetical protein M1835_003880 [Candelina submexicana]|nr:MAG: hypothetical protein M1835_003880 [Candelina submexicana]
MANEDLQNPPVALAPPPWKCKCEAYWLIFYASGPLLEDQYAPLEATSPAWTDPQKSGHFRGGLGMIQVVRYLETPVGASKVIYRISNVMNAWADTNWGGGRRRIYVSQKETCYNGRKNWNIPKHLARFSFTHPPTTGSAPSQALKVEVFPPEKADSKPFFTANLKPFRWFPAVPFSTKACPWLGLNVHLVQPPLPASGKAGEEVSCGTDHWMKLLPYMATNKARVMWVDVKGAKRGEESDAESQALLDGKGNEGWFPDMQPWQIGLWLEDATLIFEKPQILNLT